MNDRGNLKAKKAFDSNLIDKYLLYSFNKDWQNFQCDSTLLELVDSYSNSQWDDKEIYMDLIHTWFIKNRNDKWLNSWNNNFDLFMKFLDNHYETTHELTDSLQLKLYKNKENLKKARYIKENSDINDEVLWIAESCSINNQYHNFWHQLWAAETAIRLANNSNMNKNEVNLLALVALFHDAGYIKDSNNEDLEEKAFHIAEKNIPKSIINSLNIDMEKFHYLILATKIENRWIYKDEMSKIIQDSDLWWLWNGPYYLLYSSMGILEENWVSPRDFIQFEESFIDKIENWWDFYLSESWKQLLISPRNSIEEIKQRPKEAILYADSLKKENISFDEFVKKMNEFLKI